MKPLLLVITIACLVVTFNDSAGERVSPEAKCLVKPPADLVSDSLQGKWEGAMVGDGAKQKVTITITGDALHFHRDADFWFETTIALPGGKDPKQLHATITGCPPSQGDSVGELVKTVFKVEEGLLTIATIGDDAEESPIRFEDAGTRYELRRVLPE